MVRVLLTLSSVFLFMFSIDGAYAYSSEVPLAFAELIDVKDFRGDAGVLIGALARHVGFSFEEVGGPFLIHEDFRHVAILDVLQRVGGDLGSNGSLTVDLMKHRMELRHAEP